jgi:hypothetical protein
MKLYVVIQEEVGFYDEPDKHTIKGIYTNPESVAKLDIPLSYQKEVSVITFEEEHLNKRVDISLTSFFGFNGEEVKIENYSQFIKEHNLEKKPKKKM